ncbi:MAG: Lacal_2735 family protein [Gammaproteobacteria bacterium]|nr:Lacal_2735 family protein [Gammaproteobacteria bacterium]
MFGWLKSDPVKKLRKAYDQKLEQAMHAQRNGDMRLFADLTAESEELWQKIQQLEKTTAQS